MTARYTAATTPLVLDGEHGTLAVARDRAGRITLVDLRAGTHGSALGGLSDALGSALTLALRHGAPAELLLDRRTAAVIPGPRPPIVPPLPALHAALTEPL